MAEVVGLAASIIQIGGAGTKLSIELYNFVSTASRAKTEIVKIASDVELTSKVLGNVGEVLAADDAKKLVNQDAVQHAKDLIGQCEEVFKELSSVVEKTRNTGKDGKPRVGFRAKMGWPMKEQRVELLRRRLETLKSSLLVLFYVLQLAHDKARGDVEAASLEEQRKNIRELHQQQQDSLKILRSLEQKLCGNQADNQTPVLAPMAPSGTPSTKGGTVTALTSAVASTASHDQTERNMDAMDLFANLGPDTSDSDTFGTDDEGEHLTLHELAECATHVQKLLRRITMLQESLKNGQAVVLHRKRRMHKVYRRFCQKFEANIVDPIEVTPMRAVSHQLLPADRQDLAAHSIASGRRRRHSPSRMHSLYPRLYSNESRSGSRRTPMRLDSPPNNTKNDHVLVSAGAVPVYVTQERRPSSRPNAEDCDLSPSSSRSHSYDTRSQASDPTQRRSAPRRRSSRSPVDVGQIYQQSVNTRSASREVYGGPQESYSYDPKSRSPSYIRTSDYSGSQLSVRDSHISAPYEHPLPPSRRASYSTMSPTPLHTMPYRSLQGPPPSTYYQAQQMQPVYDRPRPPLQARASTSSQYDHPVQTPTKAERSNRSSHSTKHSQNTYAPPVQRRLSRVEYDDQDPYDNLGSESESDTNSEGDTELAYRPRNDTTSHKVKPTRVGKQQRPSPRYSSLIPTSQAADRKRPRTVVIPEQRRQRKKHLENTDNLVSAVESPSVESTPYSDAARELGFSSSLRRPYSHTFGDEYRRERWTSAFDNQHSEDIEDIRQAPRRQQKRFAAHTQTSPNEETEARRAQAAAAAEFAARRAMNEARRKDPRSLDRYAHDNVRDRREGGEEAKRAVEAAKLDRLNSLRIAQQEPQRAKDWNRAGAAQGSKPANHHGSRGAPRELNSITIAATVEDYHSDGPGPGSNVWEVITDPEDVVRSVSKANSEDDSSHNSIDPRSESPVPATANVRSKRSKLENMNLADANERMDQETTVIPSESAPSSSTDEWAHSSHRRRKSKKRSERGAAVDSDRHRKRQRPVKTGQVLDSRSTAVEVLDWADRGSRSPPSATKQPKLAPASSSSKRRRAKDVANDANAQKAEKDIVDILLEQWTVPVGV